MTIKINKHTFSGTSNIFNGVLATALIALAQGQAVIAAGTITDLTDNVGGAANGALTAIPAIANSALGANDCSPKAGLETAFGTVRDGLSEVIAQLNDIRAVVPAFDALTDNTGGAAADGTVGAVTVTVAGAGTDLASAVRTRAVVENLAKSVAQAVHFTNLACRAVGVAPLTGSLGVVGPVSTTFAAVSLDTGATTSGADATDANAAIKATEANAVLAALRDAVKECVVKLNAVTSGVPTVTVVAG